MMFKLPVPQYKQGADDYACGPVCIRMSIDYLQTRARLPRLDRVAIGRIEHLAMKGRVCSPSGTSYSRMKDTIRKMGFGCREIIGRTDEERQRKLRQALANHRPVILGCMADLGPDRYRHYIVLIGIDDKFIRIRDPYPEERSPKVLITDFLKNGNPISWGNYRWGIEVYTRKDYTNR